MIMIYNINDQIEHKILGTCRIIWIDTIQDKKEFTLETCSVVKTVHKVSDERLFTLIM